MKKRLIAGIICVMLCLINMPVFSNELSAVWNRIYNSKSRVEERLVIMQKIVDLHDRNMEPVLADALRNIVYSRDESMTYNDKQLTWDLTIMILKELGDIGAVDSALEMHKLMKDTEDEFVRAAAIAALGMVGARDYADEIAEYLRYINYDIVQIDNPERRHSVVDACVLSLERFRLPVGFEPVLFASVGRYARSTVKRAEIALRKMVADPTDIVVNILRADNTFQMRYAALGVEDRSEAPPERKTEAAGVAIEVGLIYNKTQLTDYEYMTRTRVKACEMIRDSGYANPQAVEWLGRLLNESTNTNELVTCLQAFGVYKSDRATELMATFLDRNNDLKSDGKQYDHERVIRECINSLGKTGNPKGREALLMVEYSGWSAQTMRMAKYALSNM